MTATNATTNSPASAPLRVTIVPLKPDHRGQPYSVYFEGKTIIAKSRVPSHDACRHLVSLGLSGPMEVWADGEVSPRLHIRDIERAARWTVKEGQNHGPRVTRYERFDREKFTERLERDTAAAA